MTPERKRPTHTVIVPPGHLFEVLRALVHARCTFTCEPSPCTRTPDVWHVGLLADGVAVVNETFGPTSDIGTLGDYL